jgi:predicted esterase
MNDLPVRAATGTDLAFSPRRGQASSSMHRGVKHVAGVIAACAALLLAACSNGNDNSALDSPAVRSEYAVGTTSITLVDSSRPTAAHGSMPERSTRTLETTVVYPTEGAAEDPVAVDAPVDTWGAPFPLIILSHGLGGSVEGLLPLAWVWASRGYVVALPRFPLTNNATPGGPVGEDVQNQPADVSFLIDQLLAHSSTAQQRLSNAINGDRIAVGGHSNGGITTYGLVANSCCRDQRIDAAIVFAGVTSPFGGGDYDLSDTPPILLVHGVNDTLLIYNQAVRTYNKLQPPKGLLTLEASDHLSFFIPADAAFTVVADATADFLDAELRGDDTALERLPEYVIPGIATMHWAPNEASDVPVELLPEPETNRQASISADTNLTDGQSITVSWSGFLPGKVVNIMQCAGDGTGGAAACNISGGKILVPNPEGSGSLELVIRIGPIGNGVCDSAKPCVVLVNDAGLTDDEAILRIPITLAN